MRAPEASLDEHGETARLVPDRPKRRFPLVEFRDIKMSTSALYLVKGLVPREGLVIVWGPPKCGKSFWVFDVTMHVALAWEYRGRRVTPGRVVYVACEGERGLGARVEAFRRAKLGAGNQAPPFHLLTTALDLAAEHVLLISEIRAQIGPGECAAIVIDTLNRSLNGSESSDEDMGAYVKAADAIRAEFHCAVIVIHHCGLDDTRPRGHTSLAGAADAQISVKRDAAGSIVATVELMKDGEAGGEIRSKLDVIELGNDDDGEPITSCIIEPIDSSAPIPKKPPKFARGAKIAIDMLRRAIDEAGQAPPANNHTPSAARAVAEDLWRTYCYQGSISASEKQEARQKAFKRAADELQASGIIGVWNGWVWII